MRFRVATLIIFAAILTASCGRATTNDSTIAAVPESESPAIATSSQLRASATPILVPTATVEPSPTSLPPTQTPDPTPTRVELDKLDVEALLRSSGDPPSGFALGRRISRVELLEGIADAINEASVDIVGTDVQAKNVVSLLIFNSLRDTNRAFAQIVEGFGEPVDGDAIIVRHGTVSGLGDQAKVGSMTTRVEGIPNFAFIDMVFTRCQALVFLRLSQPPRNTPYSQVEVAELLQDSAVYLQSIDTLLEPYICQPGTATSQLVQPLVVMLGEQVPVHDPLALPESPQATGPTANPNVPVVSTPRPSGSAGVSLNAPVAYGKSAQVTRNNGDAVFDVAVVDVVRGNPAEQMMLNANMFNGRPEDPSLEWILVRIKGVASRVSNATGTVFGDPLGMRIYANQRVIGQPLGRIPPEPRLEGIYLTGAQIDGWAAFFVAKNDPNPVLFIGDSFLNDKGVYFALNPASGEQATDDGDAVRVIVSSSSANLRQGPGTDYAIVATTARGNSFDVVARNATDTWWQVCCVNGQNVWVSSEVVTVRGDQSAVPVAGQ